MTAIIEAKESTAEIVNALMALPEVYVQKLVRHLFDNPGRMFTSTSGDEIEVLACGEWNLDAGPDFREAAFVCRGSIECGDVEVHMRASDWRRHGHHHDERFRDVLVHAVLENDLTDEYGRYTVVLPARELYATWRADLRRRRQTRETSDDVLDSLQVLQEYAARRLERKMAYARELFHMFDVPTALLRMLGLFFDSLNRKKRRPAAVGLPSEENWRAAIRQSVICRMLQMLLDERLREDLGVCLDRLVQTQILDEGHMMRWEIIINVVFPMAMYLANQEQRRQALDWYWAQKSVQTYGRLRRVFGRLPQDTVWQQQGMLEYFHEIRSGRQRVCDLMFRYNASAVSESELIYYSGDLVDQASRGRRALRRLTDSKKRASAEAAEAETGRRARREAVQAQPIDGACVAA